MSVKLMGIYLLASFQTREKFIFPTMLGFLYWACYNDAQTN